MFKGYIPTGGKDGKRPTEEYKDRVDFYSLEDVESLNSYGGVLKDNIIQIDIDDKEQSDILYKIIKELNINTTVLQTTRGKHFYFLNPGIERRKQGYYTALGIKIDVGLGIQNAVVPLKVKGRKRKFLKTVEDIDTLPAWLIPLSKREINFATMAEGDGRNSSLYGYILTLQQKGLTREDIREAIRIINKYILVDPLDEKEIEVILRDEAFLKESFYIKSKLQYEKLALYLRDNEKIIKINDELHIYKNNYYCSDTKEIEKTMLKYINNSTNSIRTEVLRYLDLLCKNTKMTNPKYVLLENGIFDLENKKLLEFNSSYIIRNKIPWSYNPNAYSQTMDKTLDKICCKDKQLRLLIEEMIGYTLFRRNELGKAFILTGGGSNGKSTLLEVLNELLGEENIASVSLEELNHRFKTFQLEGKLANIGDDISNKYIEDNSTFKKLVTGEKVNVERKGRDPFDFKNYSKLIFSANELPRINDLSGGLKRRLIFIPFNATFSKKDKDYDPFILDKLTSHEAMEYLLKLALEGLNRVLINHIFTNAKVCDDVWEEYEAINNPIVGFLEDNDIENEPVKEVYLRYSAWCSENGLKSVSKPVFSREVQKQGYTSNERIRINGKQKRIYKKI
ncbi:TPA: phage/plasmid primase, P4 family [Clostridium botulinum]|uniref:phage/plasmid primase, P4 family n=3 Tax=Clostridium botulinum TaxID=1491 RepID=UPI00035BA6D4|nr:phage/plasmid primase, P4 family [Clostridium botulinum]EPS55286.1 phage primase [Clostridium botulinum Af84]MBN3349038.1 DNA primase [Clostridium botulinum]MBN3356606.1 DNA primase [Clostridium botulinum]NFM81070.1 DNA primase [Clostridium botulinum]NFP10916.1 DNA primase [Clostridium botulinum]